MRNKIEIILLFTCIVGLSIYYFYQFGQEKKVYKEAGHTSGLIIDYYVIFPSNHYLEYEYYVKGVRFTKTINVEMKYHMDKCAMDKSCIGASVPIIYEISHPENSVLELEHLNLVE